MEALFLGCLAHIRAHVFVVDCERAVLDSVCIPLPCPDVFYKQPVIREPMSIVD